MKKFYFIIVILVIIQIFFSSVPLAQGDIYYNEDVARDFLILEQIITQRDITLIGPRTLGIPGLFHGPLWIYVNLPAYLMGQGNPVIIGAFWVLLYALYLTISFIVARKLFDTTVAMLSVLLLSSVAYFYIFNNTFGALLLFPLYFYFFVRYLEVQKVKHLLIAFFLLGLIIQFEMAFGGPILLIMFFYLLYFLAKKKKLRHLLSVFILLIPLITYVLFELKNDFIQLRALGEYFTEPASADKATVSYWQIISERLRIIFYDNLQYIAHHSLYLTILIWGMFFYAFFVLRKNKKQFSNYKLIFGTFLLLFVGYWFITLVYKGHMWLWYYYEFLPIWVILFCALYRLMHRYLFLAIFVIIYVAGINSQVNMYQNMQNSFLGKSSYSWTIYAQTAKNIYSDASKDFGYFISEHDDLGYRTRYAMHYFQSNASTKSYENSKMQTTYLIYDKPDGNQWWKEERVRIMKDPVKKSSINNINLIEKYSLTKEEILIPADPNLVNSLIFR